MSKEPNVNDETPVFESAPTPESETGDIGSMDTPVAEPEEVDEAKENEKEEEK